MPDCVTTSQEQVAFSRDFGCYLPYQVEFHVMEVENWLVSSQYWKSTNKFHAEYQSVLALEPSWAF